ncbi:hypothetical protein MPTK1_3g23530 [Marchantia polymorpha subsp. ruderalis]|uniref:Uncharacterized protein n=2 Tax=Marchantia polymorpha TaxID=3197 RepID=A0A176VY80_MARPO|nr:hypothetical protein AXG93_4620s1250 [Marchantia polymorpha subsp. ruderalis]PTQ43640.1 hypothetical protein MARPO_0024s0129 [Marchantia polymorpha]PTQ43641.1 hypothetical protein MARPO_0024s0129 [Marchantia polymorpha]BBN06741.1 hypothetical protein Mp_3g23530 [Marchantia polymorpha subsp. ruderalis]BBN06742.1 hypothetical protein Mp_3g23530 [Marchantia polymorpha subsp. ruderalis]|eukprot:PTQ43640.1 hypothetical protein MARPO_0024s0129 [Marchantia polymorpha]
MDAGRCVKMGVGSEADLGVESSVRRAIDRSRRDRNDGCYYSTLFNSVCSLDKNEAGKPVQICEKTEKLLRRCAGRPQEVVESRTEKTIEDVSTSSSSYLADNHVGPNRRFQQPPIQIPEEYREEWPRRGMESSILHELFERNGDSFARGIEELVEAAEDMVQEVFGPFGLADEALPRQPSEHREDRPSGWLWEKFLGRGQNERPKHNETNSQQSQPQKPADYSGLVRNIQEV